MWSKSGQGSAGKLAPDSPAVYRRKIFYVRK
jgi:hypothetical protein